MSGYDGNIFFLNQHMRAEDEWLKSRPLCAVCKDPIQGDIYETYRGNMCEDCARVLAEDLAEEFIRDTMEDWKR